MEDAIHFDLEAGLIHPVLEEHDLREVFNGLRYIVKTGAPWRWMPNDLPPWASVYQQTQRCFAAGRFEAMVHNLRAVLRLPAGGGGRTKRHDH